MAAAAETNIVWHKAISLVVFIMFALCLLVPGGHSIGPTVLLLSSLALLLPKRWRPAFPLQLKVNAHDRWLALAFLTYFLVLLAEIIWFHLKFRELDKPSRFLLAIPVLFFLIRTPPRVVWLWRGIVVGALCAGTFAIYQKLWLGHERANGFLYPIEFGDLSMLLGVLCMMGMAWGQEQPRRGYWISTMALGAAMGIGASLLSGSRGGWVGLPLICLVIMRSYARFMSLKQWLGVIASVVICAVTVISIPETGVTHRVHQIYLDVKDYQKGNHDTSLGARFDLWRMANYMYGHRPIFGYGTYGFVEMRNTIHDKFGYGQGVIDQDLQSAHNEYLDAAAKRGSIGVLALLGVYLVPLALFSRYRKSRDMTMRSLAMGGAMIPICFMDFGMSQVLFTHNDAVMVYPYAIAVFWACLRYRQEQLRWTNSGFLSSSK